MSEGTKKKKSLATPIVWLIVAGLGFYGAGVNWIASGFWAAVGVAALVFLIMRMIKR